MMMKSVLNPLSAVANEHSSPHSTKAQRPGADMVQMRKGPQISNVDTVPAAEVSLGNSSEMRMKICVFLVLCTAYSLLIAATVTHQWEYGSIQSSQLPVTANGVAESRMDVGFGLQEVRFDLSDDIYGPRWSPGNILGPGDGTCCSDVRFSFSSLPAALRASKAVYGHPQSVWWVLEALNPPIWYGFTYTQLLDALWTLQWLAFSVASLAIILASFGAFRPFALAAIFAASVAAISVLVFVGFRPEGFVVSIGNAGVLTLSIGTSLWMNVVAAALLGFAAVAGELTYRIQLRRRVVYKDMTV